MAETPAPDEVPTAAVSSKGETEFRWRAEDVSRVEGFSDAVFALTLTLLVVSTEVPKTYAGLLTALGDFVPFTLTFALVCMIWHEHFLFFRRYGLRDGFCRFWNLVLLLLVLFYVYPLKFLVGWLVDLAVGAARGTGMPDYVPPDQIATLMQIYGAGYAAVFAVLALLYLHAWRQRHALGLDGPERVMTRGSVGMHAIQCSFGLVSVALATFVTGRWGATAAGFVYFGIGPTLAVHGAWIRAAVRRSRDAGAVREA